MKKETMNKKEIKLQETSMLFASCPGHAVEFKIDNGLNVKFRWLDNPNLIDVRKICTKSHSMSKSKNIAAYTGVITVEVNSETVHFIFWSLNNLSDFIENVKNYSKIYLGLAHEVVYDDHCCGRVTGRGTILNAVLQKSSPKLYVLISLPVKKHKFQVDEP